MAQFEVVHKFKNKDNKTTYEVGQEIDVTVKRADEINKAMLERYGVAETLKRVEEESE